MSFHFASKPGNIRWGRSGYVLVFYVCLREHFPIARKTQNYLVMKESPLNQACEMWKYIFYLFFLSFLFYWWNTELWKMGMSWLILINPLIYHIFNVSWLLIIKLYISSLIFSTHWSVSINTNLMEAANLWNLISNWSPNQGQPPLATFLFLSSLLDWV